MVVKSFSSGVRNHVVRLKALSKDDCMWESVAKLKKEGTGKPNVFVQ